MCGRPSTPSGGAQASAPVGASAWAKHAGKERGSGPRPAPSTVCNSGCEVGERVSGFRARASISAAEEGTEGRADAKSRAQISMSVILKPSTMLSMLRMKVSSFE